jgi:hypothetical protein
MTYEPLEIIKEIKILETKRTSIDIELRPLNLSRERNLQQCRKLEDLLGAIQELCDHEGSKVEYYGTHGRDSYAHCEKCGHTTY